MDRGSDSEIAIAGGGPAGLALAIRAARAGFRVQLFERAGELPDKACGEGLMPAGVRALESLRVLELIDPALCTPFAGIRYALENGRTVDARFRHGTGMGIRRVALSSALRRAALGAGASLIKATVRGYQIDPRGVLVETESGAHRSLLLAGADGLQSPLRRAAGLEIPPPESRRRFGLRRHFARAPWSDLVEVHWIDGGECYVTPIGKEMVNIAFLWDPAAFPKQSERGDQFATLLARFPVVAEKIGGAAAVSESRGSGPLMRPARGRAAERLALLGDAAGYVDAITGQGLSLAFAGAEALVRALPKDLSDGAGLAHALDQYDRSLRSAWRRYARPAKALLLLAERPKLRRALLGAAARAPWIFSRIVESIAAG